MNKIHESEKVERKKSRKIPINRFEAVTSVLFAYYIFQFVSFQVKNDRINEKLRSDFERIEKESLIEKNNKLQSETKK